MSPATASLDPGTHFLMNAWSCGQRSLTRIVELSTLCELMAQRSGAPEATKLAERAKGFLEKARQAAERQRPPWGRIGAFIDTIETNIHAAVCLMLRYMPVRDLLGWVPELTAVLRAHLPLQDPRRVAVEELLLHIQGAAVSETRPASSRTGQAPPGQKPFEETVDESQREILVTAVRAALEAQEREYVRVRSFRNIVYGLTVCLTILAIALGTIMAMKPTLIPICFEPETLIVCPTASEPRPALGATDTDPTRGRLVSRADYFLIELVGLIAAAVAATATLRQLRGTSVPYSVPLALALLKLPTGALTAVLGLLLMRGEFIPGLSALDTSAQIIAWAVVFGYAQQLFTRLVDERGQAILNAVGGAEHGTLMDQKMSPPPPGTDS
jgi:hypothetical protein